MLMERTSNSSPSGPFDLPDAHRSSPLSDEMSRACGQRLKLTHLDDRTGRSPVKRSFELDVFSRSESCECRRPAALTRCPDRSNDVDTFQLWRHAGSPPGTRPLLQGRMLQGMQQERWLFWKGSRNINVDHPVANIAREGSRRTTSCPIWYRIGCLLSIAIGIATRRSHGSPSEA